MVPEEEIIAVVEKSAIVIETVPKCKIPVGAKMAKSMAADRMRCESVTSESSSTTMHRARRSEW